MSEARLQAGSYEDLVGFKLAPTRT